VASKIDLLIEAERRGILPADKKPLLDEARRRGLVADSSDPRADWTPDMRAAYDARAGEIQELEGREFMPGQGRVRRGARQIVQGATLSGADELMAGIKTAGSYLTGEEGTLGERFNRKWAAEQAELDDAREGDTLLGGAEEILGGFAMGGPAGGLRGTTANAMARRAPGYVAPAATEAPRSFARRAAGYGGVGAGFGAGHAFLDAEGSVLDRAEHVPGGAVWGGIAGVTFGSAVEGALAVAARRRASQAARAQRAQGVQQEFADAGVDEFGPALSESPTVHRTASGLGSSFIGTPLQEGAATSIGQVRTRLNEMVSRETGGAPPVAMAEEMQGTLNQNLTQRTFTGRDGAPPPPNEMSTEQLQDVTGMPLPDRWKPPPAPRAEPVPPRYEPDLTPDAYLDEVAGAVPEAPPVQPRPVDRSQFKYDPQPISEADIAVPPRLAQQHNKALERVNTTRDEFNNLYAEIREAERAHYAHAEKIGLRVVQEKGNRSIQPPEGVTRFDDLSNDQKVFFNTFDEWERSIIPSESKLERLRASYERNMTEFNKLEADVRELRASEQARLTSEEAANRSTREERDYWNAVETERLRARSSQQLATQRDRAAAREAALPEAVAGTARRNAERRAAAEAKAASSTSRRQQEIDTRHAAEITERRSRQPRYGVSQFPEGVPQRYAAARAERDRAIQDYNQASREARESNEMAIGGARQRETDAFNRHMRAEDEISAILRELENPQGGNDNFSNPAAHITSRAERQAELDRLLMAEATNPPRQYRVGQEQNRAATYPDEFDAGYAMSERHAPPVQRNPLGTGKNDPTKTATINLLDDFAMTARKELELGGYKPGDLFDDSGALRQEIIHYLRPRLGDDITDELVKLSNRRSKSQFVSNLEGLHILRTKVGKAAAEARRGSGHPGNTKNQSDAMLSRLYKAIDDDINAFRDAGPGGETASAIRQSVDRAWAEHQAEMRKPLARLFDNVTPEQAMTDLANAARGGDLGIIQAYMRVMTEKSNPLRAASGIVQRITRDARNMGEFLNELGRIPPETRDVLFAGRRGREYRAELERLEAVGRRLAPFERMASGPRGLDLSSLASGARPSNLLAAAGLYFHFWPAMMSMAGAGGVARFLASPRYVRWLTELPRATQGGIRSERAIDHLSRLVTIAAADDETGDAILSAITPMFTPSKEKNQKHHSQTQPRNEHGEFQGMR
jgi:archaellum component FlaC